MERKSPLSFSMLDRITNLDSLELVGVEVKRAEVSRTISRRLSLNEDFVVNWCFWEHKSLAPIFFWLIWLVVGILHSSFHRLLEIHHDS